MAEKLVVVFLSGKFKWYPPCVDKPICVTKQTYENIWNCSNMFLLGFTNRIRGCYSTKHGCSEVLDTLQNGFVIRAGI